jgi:signal transduction histidine kinase
MFICFFILLQTLRLAFGTPFIVIKGMMIATFLNFNNPLIYSVLILAGIIFFLIYIFIPLNKHFQAHNKDVNAQDSKLIAGFAELDPEPFFRFDNTGAILMVNEAGVNLYKNGSLVGKSLSSIIPEIENFDLNKSIRFGEQLYFTSYIRNKCFRFTMKGIPELEIGQIYGSDITELKETEEKLISALKNAEESEKIKSFFLAQISHEIRSPLTAIMGYNSLIKEDVFGKIDKDLEYAFDAIDVSSKRLRRTIDQILNMSLLQAGKFELHNESVNVASIIEEIITEYKSDSRQRRLDLKFSKMTDKMSIQADRYSLIQIFSNVIDNAIKYTKKGGVEIIIGRDSLDKLFVKVNDTGIGMSEEYIKNLFVPFTQETMGYSRPYEGSGLGMALIKRFSDLNNAMIEIKSSKNIGTSIQIMFNI